MCEKRPFGVSGPVKRARTRRDLQVTESGRARKHYKGALRLTVMSKRGGIHRSRQRGRTERGASLSQNGNKSIKYKLNKHMKIRI